MVTGQSAVGIGVAVGMAVGGPVVIAATCNRCSDSGPTYRLASSPEAGLGATVGTLNQGYPLLRYEGAAPVPPGHTDSGSRPHHMGRTRGTTWQGKIIHPEVHRWVRTSKGHRTPVRTGPELLEGHAGSLE
jgi:hypothetical protein